MSDSPCISEMWIVGVLRAWLARLSKPRQLVKRLLGQSAAGTSTKAIYFKRCCFVVRRLWAVSFPTFVCTKRWQSTYTTPSGLTRELTNRVDKSLVNHVYTLDEYTPKACQGLENYCKQTFEKQACMRAWTCSKKCSAQNASALH